MPTGPRDTHAILTCGRGHRLRVPAVRETLLVRCPACGDRFYWPPVQGRPDRQPPWHLSRPVVLAGAGAFLVLALLVLPFVGGGGPTTPDRPVRAARPLPDGGLSPSPQQPTPGPTAAAARPVPAGAPALAAPSADESGAAGGPRARPIVVRPPAVASAAEFAQVVPPTVAVPAAPPAAPATAPAAPGLRPLATPPTGVIRSWVDGEPLPQLTASTRRGDGHHYLKVEDWRSGRPLVTLFVRDGETATVNLPAGSYRLKVAGGGRSWYGERHLFGTDTVCYSAREAFEFVVRTDADGNTEYTGTTVELYKQVNGNLYTTDIAVEDF